VAKATAARRVGRRAADWSGGAQQGGPREQDTRQAPTRTKNDDGGTYKIAPQPGTKAGITQCKRGGAAAVTTFALGSKARASTDEWGRTVLT
jgi:hypothetical protein